MNLESLKMKFLLLSFLFFLFLPLFLSASYTEYAIAKELKKASMQSGIDKRIIYTIAKIESNFNPLILAFVSKKVNYSFDNLQQRILPYKDRYLIQLQGKEQDLQEALRILLKQGKKVDVGLMQINSINFSKQEIKEIFNLTYNLQKATQILQSCQQIKVNLKESIECYNKGTRQVKYYNYYKRFRESFMRDFGK